MTLKYPRIVAGLKVRHRETLDERTVTLADDHIFLTDGESVTRRGMWMHYEPLPQPGDRVRVVRCPDGDKGHNGQVGVLVKRESGIRTYTLVDRLDAHYGPLSDFEVIVPEESETTMEENKPEIVEVPVDRLIALREALEGNNGREARAEAESIVSLIPKPRIVAVNLDDVKALIAWSEKIDGDAFAYDETREETPMHAVSHAEWQEFLHLTEWTDYAVDKPDLLDTLRSVVEKHYLQRGVGRYSWLDVLMAEFEAALGVSES